MSFANPLWLLLSGLAVVVLALHVRRRREQTVSSILLWRHLSGGASGRPARRLPPLSLPLVLQLLALALLVTALAGPVVTWLSAGSSQVDHLVVVLDSTASMQGRPGGSSHFELARAQADARVGGLRQGAKVSLITVTANPRVAAARLTPDAARPILAGLEPTHQPGDWQQAARLVRSLLREVERSLVLLLGDQVGAQEGEAALTTELAVSGRPPAPIEAHSVDGTVSNLGFSEVRLDTSDLENGWWRVSGEVVRSPSGPREAVIEVLFTPRGSEGALTWDAVSVEAAEQAQVEFELELQLPGAGALELRLPEDQVPFDDSAFLVAEEEARIARVLQVGPPNPELQRALRAVPHVELFEAESLPADSDDYELVVVDRTNLSRHPGTHTLWLGAAPPGAGGERLLNAPDPTGWRHDHPLASSLDWSALDVASALEVRVLPGARVLLEAAGSPLVQARANRHGHEVLVAFPLAGSNWPSLPSFPVFVARLVRLAQPGLGQAVAPGCLTGRTCVLPFRAEARLFDPEEERVAVPSWQAASRTAAFGTAASGSATSGSAGETSPESGGTGQASEANGGDGEVSLSDGVAPPAFVPSTPGLYTIEHRGGTSPLAVNAFHPLESLGGRASGVGPADGKEEDSRPGELSGEGAAADPGGEVSEARPSGDPFHWATPLAGWPLWRWLVLAGAALILLDALSAGLGNERFLRTSSLATTNPLAGRHRATLALLLGALALMAVALAGLTLPYPQRQARAVLIVEEARFLPEGADERLEGLAAGDGGDQEIAVVTLGERSRVARGFGEELPLIPAALEGRAGGDLQSALELASGLLASEAGGRIVVASAGLETSGRTTASVARLQGGNVPVDFLPIDGMPPGEALVEQVSLPTRLQPSQRFRVEGVVFSERDQGAEVFIYRDGEELVRQEVRLQAGRNRVETLTSLEEEGTYLFEVEVFARGDVFAENDRAGSIGRVAGPPSLLLVTPQTEWGELFADALEVQGVEARVVEPISAPWSLEGWLEQDVVALLNVPALDLHSTQQQQLESWVTEHGGGLLILGGENSFGPGGYYQTRLEEVSPLSSRVPREAPVVAMLFVLDRSGSMQQAVGEANRLTIAKEATVEAIELLNEESVTGVVVFDSEASVLAPVQPVSEKERVFAALEGLGASGGTAIYPALEEAFEQMSRVDAPTRHVVLMTDGLSQPGEFAAITERFREAEITISSVAIGRGADAVLLQNIARAAGGTFHATADFQALPSILAQEALLLSGTPLEEVSFVPEWGERGVEFLDGLPAELPPLHGYVLTTAKEEASVHLWAPEDDPLLASWQHGLGRVIAFASHGAGSWSRDWLDLPEYPLLWSQAVRWAQPQVPGPGLDLRAERVGDEVRVLVEATGPEGEPYSGLSLRLAAKRLAGNSEGSPTGASGEAEGPGSDAPRATRRLLETEAGRYQATLELAPGSYLLEAAPLAESEGDFEAVELPVHVSYPARYSFSAQEAEGLLAIARATDGRVLLGGEPLFPEAPERTWGSYPLWRPALALGLLLFLLSLVYRYAPRSLLDSLTPGSFSRSRPRPSG